MNLLAVDTSSSRGSLSLFDLEKSQPLVEKFWLREKSHSEIIMGAYQEILQEAELEERDIDLYAVGQGPGSFTGIRVGINLVRSLAYSFEKPVIQKNSLDILAYENINFEGRSLCLINAFRNLMYCAGYEKKGDSMTCWLEPQALSAAQLEPLVTEPVQCLGNGYAAYEKQFSNPLLKNLSAPRENEIYPRAESLAQMVNSNDSSWPSVPWKEVKPLYIRASEAEEKLGRN